MPRLSITEWTNEHLEKLGSHTLHLLNVPADKVTVACQKSANVLPNHYSSERTLSLAFDRLGKKGVATLLRKILPQRRVMRSGDLGEIFATEYINERTHYSVPINRLRWKDVREMPMRGDDVIGISRGPQGTRLRFLKTEVKSRKSLTRTAVSDARTSLDKDDGLPSGHSLIFIADRLRALGNNTLADIITLELLTKNIGHRQIKHLMFFFTGNAPHKYLKKGLNEYTGSVRQIAVGLRIRSHQNFIENVFENALTE